MTFGYMYNTYNVYAASEQMEKLRRQQLVWLRRRYMKQSRTIYVIEKKDHGLLTNVDCTGNPTWNKGYSSEAMPLIFEDPTEAFDAFEKISKDNMISIRVSKATLTIQVERKDKHDIE